MISATILALLAAGGIIAFKNRGKDVTVKGKSGTTWAVKIQEHSTNPTYLVSLRGQPILKYTQRKDSAARIFAGAAKGVGQAVLMACISDFGLVTDKKKNVKAKPGDKVATRKSAKRR